MKKILVVDDDPDIVGMTKKRLEKSGFKVFTALDGKEGMKKVLEEGPDLILLDIIMPHKDGFTMLRELKSSADTSSIPVIVLSGKGESDSLFKDDNLGAVDYFIKPCDWGELLKYIKKYV
jgi:DNA-binding response OmpR family regulator